MFNKGKQKMSFKIWLSDSKISKLKKKTAQQIFRPLARVGVDLIKEMVYLLALPFPDISGIKK